MSQWFQWVLSAIALYLLVLFLISFYQRVYRSSYHHKASHLLLITANNQASIEWLIRSYRIANQLGSKEVQVTVLDTGSTDDTLRILKRIRFEFEQLEVVSLLDVPNKEEAIQHFVQLVRKEKRPFLVLDLRETDSHQENQKSTAL